MLEIVGIFGFRRKKLSVFSIGNFDFNVYNVFKRYDNVLLQEFQTYFVETILKCAKCLKITLYLVRKTNWANINFLVIFEFHICRLIHIQFLSFEAVSFNLEVKFLTFDDFWNMPTVFDTNRDRNKTISVPAKIINRVNVCIYSVFKKPLEYYETILI